MIPVNEILQGDALALMAELPNDLVSAVIIDPPYCSGARQTSQMFSRKAMNRADKWDNENRWFGTDNLSTAAFMWFLRNCLIAGLAKTQKGGALYTFIDWRNYPLLSNVVESAGWRIGGMIVWDKMSMGLGHHYRLQHELIIYATKGSPKKTNRKDVPNIIRCKRVRRDRHPTEKPIELLKTFITMSTDPGDVVLDFFAGSGTTLVAAKELGRRYIGIELNRAYCQLAQDRLAGITGELVEVTR